MQSVKEGEAEKKSAVTELQHYGNLIFASLLQNLIYRVLIISRARAAKQNSVLKQKIRIGWNSKIKLLVSLQDGAKYRDCRQDVALEMERN